MLLAKQSSKAYSTPVRAGSAISLSRVDTRQIVIVGLTGVAAVVVLLPIVLMVSTAIRPASEVFSWPPRVIPVHPTSHYLSSIISNNKYQIYFRNSAVVAVSTMLISLVLGVLAAYGLSRFRIRGGRIMLLSIMALLMIPPVTLIIPYFRLVNTLNLYDTLPAIILVHSAFALPISIWLLKSYIDTIPPELEQAAMTDGATRLQALTKIVVPLMVPGLVATGTFAFIFSWNEFLLALTVTESSGSQTLPIGMAAFFGEFGRDWSSIMALGVLASLPLLLVFIFFQRYIVQGISSGALK